MSRDSERKLPPRLPTLEKFSESAAAYAVHHFVVPWLLVPVFSSGLLLVSLFSSETKPAAREGQILEWCLGGLGVLGTIVTVFVIRYLRRRPAHWQLFHLGRASWIFLFSIAWLAGVGCGVFVFSG